MSSVNFHRNIKATLGGNRPPLHPEWQGEPVISDQLVAWVGRHILPHERQLRALLRADFPSVDVDDVA